MKNAFDGVPSVYSVSPAPRTAYTPNVPVASDDASRSNWNRFDGPGGIRAAVLAKSFARRVVPEFTTSMPALLPLRKYDGGCQLAAECRW